VHKKNEYNFFNFLWRKKMKSRTLKLSALLFVSFFCFQASAQWTTGTNGIYYPGSVGVGTYASIMGTDYTFNVICSTTAGIQIKRMGGNDPNVNLKYYHATLPKSGNLIARFFADYGDGAGDHRIGGMGLFVADSAKGTFKMGLFTSTSTNHAGGCNNISNAKTLPSHIDIL
jgi:hypothetical protein